MKELTGTGALANFSKDAPVKCLEKADEDLIAGTLQDDTLERFLKRKNRVNRICLWIIYISHAIR